MKLITFQSFDALKDLFSKGYLECDELKINKDKVGYAYDFISSEMNKRIENKYNTKYPLWCWVKCFNHICPPKRKGTKVEGFDVKITFNKKEKDVLITDFRRYSFLLNNSYIPNTLKELNSFNNKLKKYNISREDLESFVRKDKYKSHRTDKEFLDICNDIKNSFDRCITKNSDILQGCVWRIYLSDIDKIEIIKDDDYKYGSLNYIRSNGKRMNWEEDFYKKYLN